MQYKKDLTLQNIQISNNIKKLCKDKGISINHMLKHCGISKSFIYDLEKRSTSPSCYRLSIIADYLDCSVDYLLGRTDNPEFVCNQDLSGNKLVLDGEHYFLEIVEQKTGKRRVLAEIKN